MPTRAPAGEATGPLSTPAADETGTFVTPEVTSRSTAARLGDLFTRPLEGHVSLYRGPARTLLLAVALVLSVGVLVVPSGAPYRTGLVLGTVTALAVLLAISPVRRLQPFLDRATGLAMVAGAHVLVAGTGGAASPLHHLYLLMVVYFAAFYTTRRLAATGVLAGISLVLTEVGPHAGDAPAHVTDLVTSLVAWTTIVVTVHLLVQRLRASAHTDALTGLANHGTFWDAVTLEHARAQRNDSCYSVLIADLDHFKAVNDSHGHQTGDEILRRVAEVLQRRTRRVDVAARYGGEEFAVVLPFTGTVGARVAGEKVRSRIARMSSPVPVTASVGVATYRAGDDVPPDGVVRAADEALYRAKRGGRDRVEVAPMPGPEVRR